MLRYWTLLAVVAVVLCGAGIDAAHAIDDPEFHWTNNEKTGQADLLFGEVPVLRYMYALDTSNSDREHETYKVYHHVL